MKFVTAPGGDQPTIIEDAANSCCLRRADQEWAMDDIVISAADGRPIPTDAIDRLPPWRACVYVDLAIRAGGRMEHGDLTQLRSAADIAGGHAEPGWWRAALGLDPVDPMTLASKHSMQHYVAPTGWKVVRRPDNSGPF